MEKILAKLTSGKFILTVIAGLVFAYATYANILEAQAISAILSAVFTNYFLKKEENGN